MSIIQFIIATAFITSLTLSKLTLFSQQQAIQILQRQNKDWQNIQIGSQNAEINIFRIDNMLDFFLQQKNETQVVKMRGKGYFFENNRINNPQSISPFDGTKVYVYSKNGLIIKSQEFYTSFAFKFEIKANEKCRIMFVDGPPGPAKIISWEVIYEHSSTVSNVSLLSIQQKLNNQLNSLLEYVEEILNFWGISNVLFLETGQQLLSYEQRYFDFIKMEIGLIILCLIIQMKMMDRIISEEQNMII